jgi:hypothetical protein
LEHLGDPPDFQAVKATLIDDQFDANGQSGHVVEKKFHILEPGLAGAGGCFRVEQGQLAADVGQHVLRGLAQAESALQPGSEPFGEGNPLAEQHLKEEPAR